MSLSAAAMIQLWLFAHCKCLVCACSEASLLLIRTYGLHVKTHDRKPEHVACMRILNCPLQLRARSSTLRASWRQAVACMSISHRQCPQLTTGCRGLQSRPAQLASSFDGLYSELKTHILAHLPVCLRVGLRVAGRVRGCPGRALNGFAVSVGMQCHSQQCARLAARHRIATATC